MAQSKEFEAAWTAINQLTSTEELRSLNKAVVGRLDMLSRQAAWTIRPGMKVSWVGKHGFQVGTVRKVKSKYVEVVVPNPNSLAGMIPTVWNVPASALKVEP